MHFVQGENRPIKDDELRAEVVREGVIGQLNIKDHEGNIVGTYAGPVTGVQALDPWRAPDQKDELSALATELQRRYVGYMQQKEYMSYLGFAVYLTAAATILLLEDGKWPPPNWGSHKTVLAYAAIVLFWFFAFSYLRFELRRRRWAAMRVGGCESVLVKLATNSVCTDAWKPYTRKEAQAAKLAKLDADAEAAAADAAAVAKLVADSEAVAADEKANAGAVAKATANAEALVAAATQLVANAATAPDPEARAKLDADADAAARGAAYAKDVAKFAADPEARAKLLQDATKRVEDATKLAADTGDAAERAADADKRVASAKWPRVQEWWENLNGRSFIGLLFPVNKTVAVIRDESQYPKIFVQEWLKIEACLSG